MRLSQTAGKNRRTMKEKELAIATIASIQVKDGSKVIHIVTSDGEVYTVTMSTEELARVA